VSELLFGVAANVGAATREDYVSSSGLGEEIRWWMGRRLPASSAKVLPLAVGLGAVITLQTTAPGAAVRAGLASVDFDPARTALLTAWIGAAVAGLLAALLGARPWWAALAAGAFVAGGYIGPLAWSSVHTAPVILGTPQRLNAGALLLQLATIQAVGLLVSFVAAASGRLLAETVAELAAAARRASHAGPRLGGRILLARASPIGLLIVSVGLASAGMQSLVRYGPTDGIYAFSSGNSHSPAPAGRGSVELRAFYSTAMGQDRPFAVYLPPGYTADTSRRYPVIYLLHGDPGGYRDWLHLGTAGVMDVGIAKGALAPAIVVLPEGGGQVTTASQWADRYDGRDRVEDSILELVALIDRNYRTWPDREHRVIAGLSEGGYGATNLAARHPDLFGTAISLSGYFQARGPVFGTDPSNLRANSPADLVSRGVGPRSVRYLLVAGNQDGRYLQEARAFALQLQRLKVDHELVVLPGAHGGSVWINGLALGLEQIRGQLRVSAV
jgi:enterochelin esterase-like enzyme